MIGLSSYHQGDEWVAYLSGAEAEFLHPNMEVGMFIEWPECTVDLRITTKEFLEEYYIFLGNSMYGNFDTALLWLRMLAKFLVNECNLKRSK